VLDIVGKRAWYFLFSALIIIPGIVSMALPPGWPVPPVGIPDAGGLKAARRREAATGRPGQLGGRRGYSHATPS